MCIPRITLPVASQSGFPCWNMHQRMRMCGFPPHLRARLACMNIMLGFGGSNHRSYAGDCVQSGGRDTTLESTGDLPHISTSQPLLSLEASYITALLSVPCQKCQRGLAARGALAYRRA